MPDDTPDMPDYVTPPAHSFWKWADDGESITWPGGQTIGFRVELEHVLSRHAARGLPPLSLVLLVLAACRDSWKEVISSLANLESLCGTLSEIDSSAQKKLIDGLMAISQLPAELKYPVEAKSALLEFLFEDSECYATPRSVEGATQAVHLWRNRPGTSRPSQAGRPPGLRAGLEAMLRGLERLDAEALLLRSRTGLDQLVRPAQVDVDPVEQARRLIASLQSDTEVGGVARVARALMAVVHLPRQISESDELPMGGVSDITNRGPLDRLLTSELAHDNTMLALRVATNEALYLRRETPPKTPAPRRLILIDVGIRMWGVPRVFAAAVAMALTATADSHAGALTFRARGDRVEAADLKTRQGLMKHLAVLEPDPHPGLAVDRMLGDTAMGARQDDVVIVTTADTLADRDFQQRLARHSTCPLHVATVDRSGEFVLSLQQRHGRKVVCAAQLDLKDLLLPRHRPTSPLRDDSASRDLPAIFRVQPFPLRLPTNAFNASRSWVVPECGVLEIAKDGRLLLWDQIGRGPLQICEQIAANLYIHWTDPQCRDGTVTAIVSIGNRSRLQILNVHIDSQKVRLNDLELDDGRRYVISGHNGVVFAVSNVGTSVLSGKDGRRLQTLHDVRTGQAEPVLHSCGRFFRDRQSGKWYALAYDGQRTQLEVVVSHSLPPGRQLISMFDVAGREGPVGMTGQGELYYPGDDEFRRPTNMIAGPLESPRVSGCGNWVSVRSIASSDVAGIVDVAKQCFISNRLEKRSLQSLEASIWVQSPRNVLHCKFRGVTIDTQLGLALVSRPNQLWSIQMDQQRQQLWFEGPIFRAPRSFQADAFSDRITLGANRWALRCATWEDGSRAYLDDRCVLHLRSSDRSVPEVSLVLADGEISGWCSDGGTWGHPWFLADAPSAHPGDVWDDAIRPFLERLP